MTNLTLQHPTSTVGSRWFCAQQKTESWRHMNSLPTETEMPDTNTSSLKSSSSNTTKGKRLQSKEKSRKSFEERQNNTSPDLVSTSNIKQERVSSREASRVPPNIQVESGSPNQSAILSPSGSPKSPSSLRHNRTPSSAAGTPPHTSFTPPTSITPTCFSPASMGGLGAMAGLPNPLGAIGLFNGAQNLTDAARNINNVMPRNCSDLMRSMAAKYNNNSSNNLSYYNNGALGGFPRPPIPPPDGFPNTGFLSGLPNETSLSPVQPLRDSNSKIQDNSTLKRPNPGGLPAGLPPHLLSQGAFPGLPTNPLMDLSSTQVLINMVRNASNIHQSHIQKTQSDLHTQHHFQKQLLYQQQLHQQQAARQQIQEEHQQLALNKQLQNSPSIKTDEQTQKNSCHISGNSDRNETHQDRASVKRPAEAASPLDLSATVPSKHMRPSTETDINVEDDDVSVPHVSPDTPNSPMRMKSEVCTSPVFQKHRFDEKEDTTSWTVEDVFNFVRNIDICAEYAENFREQRIDGACLLLLSESHLTDSLKMKLGPALKLRSFLSSRSHQRNNHHYHYQPLSPSSRSCNHCTSYTNNNNNNGELICKKLSYTDSVGTDLSSPRLSVVSPVHTSKSLSPTHQPDNGSPNCVENKVPTTEHFSHQ